MNQADNPTQLRQISLTEKKQIMWNIIEPGDPYDIRKSMIAKLPGQQKFMGAHLQLVCLLQAAEIQRLCQFLDEHKLKLKQSERISLDRHSYEIQIKELSEKMIQQEGFRIQNEKLKDYIRKLSSRQIELTQNNNQSELTQKYQESLMQIQQLFKENKTWQLENGHLQQQLKIIQSTKIRQIQDLIQKINSEASIRLQIEQEMKGILQKKEIENQQHTQQINSFHLQIKQLVSQIQYLQKDNHLLRQSKDNLALQKIKTQQMQSMMNQYTKRFQMFASQIDRLNTCLRDKSKQLNEQYVRNKQIQDEKRYLSQQSLDLQLKIKNLSSDIIKLQQQNKSIRMEKSTYEQRQTLIHQYESRLQKLSIQVNRLNNVLRKKVNQLEEVKSKIREQELVITNLQFIQKETEELRKKFSDFTKKMFQYEKQITLQIQEIDRLNVTLKKMAEETSLVEIQLKKSQKELDLYIKKSASLENETMRLIRMIEEEKESKEANDIKINQLISENQEKTSKLRKIDILTEENIKLKAQVFHCSKEQQQAIERVQQKIGELKNYQLLVHNLREEAQQNHNTISNLTIKINNYEKDLENIQEENSQLRSIIQDRDSRSEKSPVREAESPQKKEDIQNLTPMIDDSILESRYHKLQQQLFKKSHQYQNIIIQNDSLIQKLIESESMLHSLRDKHSSSEDSQKPSQPDDVSRLKQEIIRSNSENIALSDALDKLRTENNQLSLQNKDKQRKIDQMNEHYKKVLIFSEQINRLNLVLRDKQHQIQGYLQNLFEYKQTIKKCQDDIHKLTIELKNSGKQQGIKRQNKNELNNLRGDVQKLLREGRDKDELVMSYQTKITMLGQEVQRLNNILKDQVGQNQRLVHGRQSEGRSRYSETRSRDSDGRGKASEARGWVSEGRNQDDATQKTLKKYQNLLIEQTNQIQRLNELINSKNQSQNKLNSQYLTLKSRLQTELSQVHQKFRQYEGRISQLSLQLQSTAFELNNKTNLIKQLQNYQLTITEYKSEINRLNNLLKDNTNMFEHVSKTDNSYLQQIQRLNNLLKLKMEEGENKDIEYQRVNKLIEELTNQLKQQKIDKDVNKERTQGQQKGSVTKQQIWNYHSRVGELFEEFQKLQLIMQILKSDNEQIPNMKQNIDDLIEKNRWLGCEIDRLNGVLTSKQEEVRESRFERCDSQALQRRVNEDLGTMVLLFAQIEALRLRVSQKEQEIEEIHRSEVTAHRI